MIRGDEATEAESDVMAAARRWLAATERGDADELDRLLAEGYTYTHASTGAGRLSGGMARVVPLPAGGGTTSTRSTT